MIAVTINRASRIIHRKQSHFICFDCGITVYRPKNTGRKYFCLECESRRQSIKAKAHKRLDDLIQWGMVRPPRTLKCVDCGEPAYCYDFRNYSKPKDVEPVCNGCNRRRGPGILGERYG